MKVDGFSLAVWVLLIAFVMTLAEKQLFGADPEAMHRQSQQAQRGLDYRAASESALAEKIRLCAVNVPQDECEQVFRCAADPCYCSACD